MAGRDSRSRSGAASSYVCGIDRREPRILKRSKRSRRRSLRRRIMNLSGVLIFSEYLYGDNLTPANRLH